jgi:hypothetical protein
MGIRLCCETVWPWVSCTSVGYDEGRNVCYTKYVSGLARLYMRLKGLVTHDG